MEKLFIQVSNKGRVICLTSILENDSIETLEWVAKKTITTINEGKLKSNQIQIDHCDLLLINIFPDPTTSSALKSKGLLLSFRCIQIEINF